MRQKTIGALRPKLFIKDLLPTIHGPPPPEGWLKINTDAAYANGCSTSGVIFKNKNGSVVLAATYFHHCPDAITAECLAINDACSLAASAKIKKALFSSDSLNAVTSITNSPLNCFWTENPVVEKIKKSWNNWPHWTFNYSGRASNAAVHNLAKWGSQVSFAGIVPLDVIPLSVFCDLGFSIVDNIYNI
ncbi:hypothetical protein CASFOL_040024 [Castilleja foliolosa]|uniref:RNase H type-1 domain-containing protein n=1 Tax=Castilleja foliolosa TaxID=1961234 RepID=A0ABD3BFU9_9LAMI